MGQDKVCKTGFQSVKLKCRSVIISQSPLSVRSSGAENDILYYVLLVPTPPPPIGTHSICICLEQLTDACAFSYVLR
jgi:hypothetical protein